MTSVREVLDRLAASASPSGGWGYEAQQPAHIEPTCLAIAALEADPAYATVVAAARAALEAHAQPDGSYRLSRGRPQAAWPTALVLFTRPDAAAVAERLLRIEGRVMENDPEVADMTDIDFSLMGWPWAEGTFSWVEPTAWACIALRKAGRADHPRVSEGLRLLLDRAFSTGGVNYGNRMILGKSTEPIPGPTALMLLALQGLDDPRIEAAKGYLRLHVEQTYDLEHLAWARLALACHATDSLTRATLPKIDGRLQTGLTREAFPAPMRLALVALALGVEARNPFQLGPAPALSSMPRDGLPPPEIATGRSLSGRVGSAVRGFFVNGMNRLRPFPATSAVHIAKCAEYDDSLLPTLKKQFENFRAHVPPIAGKRVVLKPNLVEYRAAKVINTDPRLIDAAIQLFKDEGAGEVVVAEGPGHWRNVQFLVEESGLGAVLRKHGVRFVDINHDEPQKELNLGRCTGLDYLYVSRTIKSADVLVSMPKLKTHHWAIVTLSLKNLFGTLPGICYGWPKNELHWRGIPNSIVDIACTTTPHLAIVDGILGMEGDGPLMGDAVPMGVLVMGVDLVAVDATCCRLMGIPPERVPTIVLANLKRLGHLNEAQVPQLGQALAPLVRPFAMPPGADKELLPLPKSA